MSILNNVNLNPGCLKADKQCDPGNKVGIVTGLHGVLTRSVMIFKMAEE